MTCEPGGDEGADGDDRLPAGPNVVEGALDQDRAQTLTPVTGVDLGVDEVMPTATDVIDREAGGLPVQFEDISVIVGIVAYDDVVVVSHRLLFWSCFLRTRPDSRTARVSRNSIWALTLRSSSAAHFSRAACNSGSTRSKKLLRSATFLPTGRGSRR